MKILLDSRQMKQCDKNTIEHFGVPSLVLMERAALSTADEIDRYFREGGKKGQAAADRETSGKKRTALIVCGFGNNGGDGLAIGRILFQRGYEATIVMPPESGRISEETRTQKEILGHYGIELLHDMPKGEFDVVIDALFGIGLTRNLEGVYREYLTEMNQKSGLKVAVDIPSGVHGDTGEVMGVGFLADLTVTFAFAKPGLLLYPGAEYAGTLLGKDIELDSRIFLK